MSTVDLRALSEPPHTEPYVRWCGSWGGRPPRLPDCARQGALTWRCKSSTHPTRGSVSANIWHGHADPFCSRQQESVRINRSGNAVARHCSSSPYRASYLYAHSFQEGVNDRSGVSAGIKQTSIIFSRFRNFSVDDPIPLTVGKFLLTLARHHDRQTASCRENDTAAR
jgi:hypothetical protein